MRQKLLIAFILVGAIMGAGFASGRELVSFFGEYGYFSIFIVILAGLLLFGFAYIMMRIGAENKHLSIQDTTKKALGKFSPILDILMLICYMIVVAAMISAIHSLFASLLPNIPSYVGSIAFSILSVFVIIGGVDRLGKVNLTLLPFMILMMFIIIIQFLFVTEAQDLSFLPEFNLLHALKGFLFMLLYLFMNLQTASEVMIFAGNNKSKSNSFWGSLIGSILITLAIVFVLLSVLHGGESVYNADMPVVEMAKSLGGVYAYLYGAIILTGVFGVLNSTSLLVHSWFKQKIKRNVLSAVIVTAVAYVLSLIGFANIVDFFYPITGIIGGIYVIALTIYYFKTRKEHKNEN